MRGFATVLGSIWLVMLPAAANAAPGQPDIDYAPISCAVGKVAGHPPAGVKNHYAHYEFQLPSQRADVETIVPRLEQDQRYRAEYRIDGGGTRLRVTAGDYMAETLDVDGTFVKLCALLTPYGFDIQHIRVRTLAAEDDRMRREANGARRFQRQWGMFDIPNEREIGELLRGSWADNRILFFRASDTEFSRVREDDVRCSYVESPHGALEDHISCEVGVLGTSPRGPEYGKGTLEFTRSRNFEQGRTNQLLFYLDRTGLTPIG